MQMVVICETFGWTYQEYLDQPVHFIALVKERMRIDGIKAEQARSKK